MVFDFFGGSMHADSPTPDDRVLRSGHVRPNGTATRSEEGNFSLVRHVQIVKKT